MSLMLSVFTGIKNNNLVSSWKPTFQVPERIYFGHHASNGLNFGGEPERIMFPLGEKEVYVD